MRRILLALVLVAGCGAGGDRNEAADAPPGKAVQTASLTGLYEGGASTRPNQMCMIDRGEGKAAFGLVVWGENMHSCSGSGEAERKGDVLRLAMAGDESCTIEARLVGGAVTLPATAPEGCAYYCGARAQLGSASFAKKGGTEADAMKAKDLVGEPLCSGL